MKLVTIAVATIFALSAASASVYAQGRGNGQAKKTTVSGPKAKSTAQTTRTAKAETRAVKAEARAAKATAKAETRAAKTTAKAETRAAKTQTTTTTTETNAFKTNPNQEARLVAMLPPGTNIQDAALGFKNRGQFIAAVNASTNHSIPFFELKARMTGIPVGSTVQTMTPMSLGQALQSFKVTPPPVVP
jgi:hypothetical protein